MPTATEDRQLPVPIASDADNVPADMYALANRLKRDLSVSYGVQSARPATPSTKWEAYVATDTGRLWISLGSVWGLIGPDAISDGAVTRIKIALNAIDAERLADASVINRVLGPKSVTWDKIADNTIGSGQLDASAVETQNVKPKAITVSLLADDVFTAISVPRVTTLPTTAVDKDTVDLVVDAANGVVWRMRYRSANTTAYKWEFVGGSALDLYKAAAQDTTVNAVNSVSRADTTFTPTFLGVYDVDASARLSFDAATTATVQESIYKGTGTGIYAGTASDPQRNTVTAGLPSMPRMRAQGRITVTALGAESRVTPAIVVRENSASVTGTIYESRLRIVPVMLGVS